MKIIQVNAWLGHLMYPLLELLEQEDPDIVCVQEVLDSDTPNPLFESFSIRSKLAELFPHHYFSPTYTFPAFGANVGMGNLILSKYPLENTQTIFTNGAFTESQTLDTFTRNIRNAQSCSITLPDSQKLTVVNHHGYHDLDPKGNAQSMVAMQKLIDHVKTLEGPIVLCGDLNLQPASEPIQQLASQLKLRNLTTEHKITTTLSPIFRVKNIQVAADYILVSPEVKVQSFGASDTTVSDHKALILNCTTD